MSLRETLQSVHTSVADIDASLEKAERQKSRILNQRQQAIDAASQQFTGQLDDIQRTITDLQASSPKSQLNQRFGKAVDRALYLASASRLHVPPGSSPISALAKEYEAYVRHTQRPWEYQEDYRGDAAVNIISRVADFEDFYTALEQNDSVPVSILVSDWSEEYDHNNFDKNSGRFIRTGSIYLGHAALKDIMLRPDTERHKRPDGGIDLLVNGMKRTDVRLGTYNDIERTTVVSTSEAATLFGMPTQNSIKIPRSWEGPVHHWEIAQHVSPLPGPSRKHSAAFGNQMHYPTVQRITWGDAAHDSTL